MTTRMEVALPAATTRRCFGDKDVCGRTVLSAVRLGNVLWLIAHVCIVGCVGSRNTGDSWQDAYEGSGLDVFIERYPEAFEPTPLERVGGRLANCWLGVGDPSSLEVASRRAVRLTNVHLLAYRIQYEEDAYQLTEPQRTFLRGAARLAQIVHQTDVGPLSDLRPYLPRIRLFVSLRPFGNAVVSGTKDNVDLFCDILWLVYIADQAAVASGSMPWEWFFDAVVFHELGHVMFAHLQAPDCRALSDPEMELEADSFSGWMLARGAGSTMQEQQVANAARHLLDQLGYRHSQTHPIRLDRGTTIREGYRLAVTPDRVIAESIPAYLNGCIATGSIWDFAPISLSRVDDIARWIRDNK